jgi:molybdate transport system ATP-binding protein
VLEFDCRVRRGSFDLEAAFSVATPGVTALFGRSGSGKSTVISLLAGLLAPERGRIVLDDLTFLDTRARLNVPAEERATGYVFQDARLFPHLNVRNNLLYGLRRVRGRPAPIRFDAIVALLGLDALLERRTGELSGGERQRVALGRALLAQPRLLLLDEPLASLDAGRRDEVLPYFERLRDEFKVPIIYVSHEFEEVLRLAEQVILLDRGRVSASGSLQQICLSDALHAIVGPGVIGTLLDATVQQVQADERLATLASGALSLRVALGAVERGARVRLYVPADDVLIALEAPRAVSARNVLPVTVTRLEPLDGSVLVHLSAAASQPLLARVTHSAVQELGLEPGKQCFALVKAVAAQGRRFDGRARLA